MIKVSQNVSKSTPSEAGLPAPFYRQKNEAPGESESGAKI